MEPGKIYLGLDAYELGQVVALLPDVAWNRMDRPLRAKFKAAQAEIEADRKPKRRRAKPPDIVIATAEVPADAPIPDDHVPIEPDPATEARPADDDFFE